MNIAFLPNLAGPDGILILNVALLLLLVAKYGNRDAVMRLFSEKMQRAGSERRTESTEPKRDWVVIILLCVILLASFGLMMGAYPEKPGALLILFLVLLLTGAKGFPKFAKEFHELAKAMEATVRQFFDARDEAQRRIAEVGPESTDSLPSPDRFAIILLCFILVSALGFALGRP